MTILRCDLLRRICDTDDDMIRRKHIVLKILKQAGLFLLLYFLLFTLFMAFGVKQGICAPFSVVLAATGIKLLKKYRVFEEHRYTKNDEQFTASQLELQKKYESGQISFEEYKREWNRLGSEGA